MKKSSTLFGLLGIAAAGIGMSLSAAETVQYNTSFNCGFFPHGYTGKEKGAWYEVRRVPGYASPVLHLEQRGVNAPEKFATWDCPPMNGATSCEAGFEIRLTYAKETHPQFCVRYCFNDPANKTRKFLWLTFGVNRIQYMNNGKVVNFPYPMGTKFHSFVLKGSLKTGDYQLFVKGSDKPLFTGKLTNTPNASLGFVFGDGAGDVFGGVDIAWIGVSAQ